MGNLPLHLVAIHRPCVVLPNSLTHHRMSTIHSVIRVPIIIHRLYQSICSRAIGKTRPESFHIHQPRGRLPLDLAIYAGKPWVDGVDALIEAYHEALDPVTELVPFLLAARSPSCSLAIPWRLLRAKPEKEDQRNKLTIRKGAKRTLAEEWKSCANNDRLKKERKSDSLQAMS